MGEESRSITPPNRQLVGDTPEPSPYQHISIQWNSSSANRGAPSVPDSEEMPRPGNTLQVVLTTVLELDLGASHEVGHGPRYENLARRRHGFNALGNMHRYSGHIGA